MEQGRQGRNAVAREASPDGVARTFGPHAPLPRPRRAFAVCLRDRKAGADAPHAARGGHVAARCAAACRRRHAAGYGVAEPHDPLRLPHLRAGRMRRGGRGGRGRAGRAAARMRRGGHRACGACGGLRGATAVVAEPRADAARERMCRMLVAEHPTTTVDMRTALLLFNNGHLPKQHFEL